MDPGKWLQVYQQTVTNSLHLLQYPDPLSITVSNIQHDAMHDAIYCHFNKLNVKLSLLILEMIDECPRSDGDVISAIIGRWYAGMSMIVEQAWTPRKWFQRIQEPILQTNVDLELFFKFLKYWLGVHSCYIYGLQNYRGMLLIKSFGSSDIYGWEGDISSFRSSWISWYNVICSLGTWPYIHLTICYFLLIKRQRNEIEWTSGWVIIEYTQKQASCIR